jgi:hypothetical protein
VDDFTHYFWSFPLCKKSDVYATFLVFHAYIATQLNISLQTIQCDNGREFDNTKLQIFCNTHDVLFRFSCPYTSQQMVRPNMPLAQPMTSSALFSFKPLFPLPSGPKLYIHLPISSTSVLPPLITSTHPTFYSMATILSTLISASSASYATQTHPPPLHINYRLAPLAVSFSVTILNIEDIVALISPLVE